MADPVTYAGLTVAQWLMAATLVVTVGATTMSYQNQKKALAMQAEQAQYAREAFEEQMALTRERFALLDEDRAKWEERTTEQREAYTASMTQVRDILEGKTNVEDSPMFASQFANLQRSYDLQKNKVLETVREGGRRDRILKELNRSYLDARQEFSGDVQKQVFSWGAGMKLPIPISPLGQGMPGYSGTPVGGVGAGADLSGLGYLATEIYKGEQQEDTTTTEPEPKKEIPLVDPIVA